MRKATATLIRRPFSMTEDDFNALEQSIKSLMLIERLADEYNPNVGTIETHLVSAALGLINEKLSAILESVSQ